MAGSVPHAVPDKQNRWLPLTLAVIVHAALFLFFWIGISWKNEVPLAVEAEIWDMQYKEAAPLPTPVVEPEPEPEPVKEAPQPEPKPVVTPPAPPKEVAPPTPDPEIALAKKKKEEQERKEAQRKEDQRKEDLRKEQEKQELLKKQEADKLAKQKEAEEKKKADELAKKKEAEDKKKADAEAKKKADADAKKKAADAKAADQRHQAELQRMMSQAGGSGTAEKTQGPRGSANYASKIAVKIRSNTVFDVPAGLSGNPAVEYTVDLLPDGSVRNVRKTKSSGVPGFDDAVARAIERSQPFPPDTDGKVPNSFNIIHRPKDQ